MKSFLQSRDHGVVTSEEFVAVYKHHFRWSIPLLATLGLVLGTGLSSLSIYSDDTGCLPNGQIGLVSEAVSVWDINNLLVINIPFGSFSFTTAKLIDVIWGHRGRSVRTGHHGGDTCSHLL